MSTRFDEFCTTAKGLSQSPIGIIALTFVLVYGFASLVALFGAAFTPRERILLVYFLISFPVLVFLAFIWLVSCHSPNLYGPANFKNEENYIRSIYATLSLTTAATNNSNSNSQNPLADNFGIVNAALGATFRHSAANTILWVDDHPRNNFHARQAFEAIGLTVTSARTTQEALSLLQKYTYSVIISDMGRREGPREGYKLLDALRGSNNRTPLFFYTRGVLPEHRRETAEHGGQGCTNNVQELFTFVTKTLLQK